MGKRVTVLILLTTTAFLLSAQVSPKTVRTAAEMDPLLASLATYEVGQSRQPQAEFTQFVQDSMASPALLKEIETRLLAFLQSNATPAGRQFALRELSLVGTEASIPVLTPMLLDPATSEMARFALARIPGGAASEALRTSLGKASGSIRVGLINSVGQRRDSQAVAALGALASSSDPSASQAALAALSQIADRAALNTLAALHLKASSAPVEPISRAYLECANHIAPDDRQSALQIYRKLRAGTEPPLIRVGALSGLASLSPQEALPQIIQEIESKDERIQFAAIRLLGGMASSDISASAERVFPSLAAHGKVRLLSGLAARADRSVEPLLVRARKDASAEVRAAALSGLGSLNDASAIPVLAEAAAGGQPVEQIAARRSLRGMRGAAIDPALVAGIGSSQGKMKAELILVAGERGSAVVGDAVVKAIGESDPDVHREALRAARSVAGPAQVPALLNLTVRATAAVERRDASQVLGLALQRSGPPQIAAVVTAYQTVPAMEQRLSLLQALGQTSSSDALAPMRAALADPAPEIVRGAVLALSEWKNTAPLPDLLAAAKGNSSPAVQVLALRGYLKLVGLPSERPNPETARLLNEAAALASQPAEKQTLLSLVGSYPCQEALQIAESMLQDEAVAKEAKAAVDRINRALAPRGNPR